MTRASRLLTHLAAVVVLLCLACGLHADTAKGVSLGWKVFAVSGQLADAGTTLAGTHDGHHETNPLIAPIAGKPAVLLATKAGLGVGLAALGNWLSHKGHPRAGKAVCAIGGGAGWVAAGWNLRQGRK